MKSYAVLLAVAAAACSSATTSSTPSATGAAAPAVADPGPLACPDSSDTPSMVAYSINRRYPAFRQNSRFAVPSCFVEAVGPLAARNEFASDDSTVVKTLEMSDAIKAQAPNDAANANWTNVNATLYTNAAVTVKTNANTAWEMDFDASTGGASHVRMVLVTDANVAVIGATAIVY